MVSCQPFERRNVCCPARRRNFMKSFNASGWRVQQGHVTTTSQGFQVHNHRDQNPCRHENKSLRNKVGRDTATATTLACCCCRVPASASKRVSSCRSHQMREPSVSSFLSLLHTLDKRCCDRLESLVCRGINKSTKRCFIANPALSPGMIKIFNEFLNHVPLTRESSKCKSSLPCKGGDIGRLNAVDSCGKPDDVCVNGTWLSGDQ